MHLPIFYAWAMVAVAFVTMGGDRQESPYSITTCRDPSAPKPACPVAFSVLGRRIGDLGETFLVDNGDFHAIDLDQIGQLELSELPVDVRS